MSKDTRRTKPDRASGNRAGSTGPSGASRAGRRERARRYNQPTFTERYRSLIVGAAVVAVVVVGAAFVFLGATTKAYACSNEWTPTTTPAPSAGATPDLGFLQDTMGNSHAVNTPQRYTFCPPATGSHFNAAGVGPVQPRVFQPTDNVGPQNWIHNLEHGALVVLYRGDSPGATPEGLDAFRDFYDSLPESSICKLDAGVVSPVIARFDEMAFPFAALVWGRVLPMDTWDPELVRQFYLQQAEKVDAEGNRLAPPEPQCTFPSPSPSAVPSGSAPASPSASAPASVAPSASASASAAPSASPSPS